MRVPPAVLLLGLAFAACADAPAPGWVLQDFVTGLGPVTDLAFLPDGRMLITEKTGALHLRGADGSMKVAARLPVDSRSEKGLLGVAVDPEFARTRRIFLYYSLADAAGGTDRDRHRVISAPLLDGGTLDLAAAELLVSGLRGPANHDGGGLAIGPDGKILRLNLDGSVPADNPLAAVTSATACGETCGRAVGSATGAPRREIWAWGLRNPWRFSFDPRTGRLWVGDVGEVTYEEIDVVEKGRHHGWPWREGSHGWPRTKCREIAPPAGDCVDPVYECRHGGASAGIDGDCQSITGGVFPDSPAWPASHRGLYLFGDNANGRIWTLTLNAARDGVLPGSRREVGRVQGMPVSFVVGPDGAVYVAVLPGR